MKPGADGEEGDTVPIGAPGAAGVEAETVGIGAPGAVGGMAVGQGWGFSDQPAKTMLLPELSVLMPALLTGIL